MLQRLFFWHENVIQISLSHLFRLKISPSLLFLRNILLKEKSASASVKSVSIFVTFTFFYIIVSVTRLGDFWKLLVINFLGKVAQIFGHTLGSFEKCNFLGRNCFGHFLGNIWQIFTIFFPQSGHTDRYHHFASSLCSLCISLTTDLYIPWAWPEYC